LESCPDLTSAIAAASGDEFVLGLQGMANWNCCEQRVNNTGGPFRKIRVTPAPNTILNGLVLTLPAVDTATSTVGPFTFTWKMWAVLASPETFQLGYTNEPDNPDALCAGESYTTKNGKVWAIIMQYCDDFIKQSAFNPLDNCVTGTNPTCAGWKVALMWISDTSSLIGEDMAFAMLFDPGIGGSTYDGANDNIQPLWWDKFAPLQKESTVFDYLGACILSQSYRLSDGNHTTANRIFTTQQGKYCTQYVYAEDWYVSAYGCDGVSTLSGPLGIGVLPPIDHNVFADGSGNVWDTNVDEITGVVHMGTLRWNADDSVLNSCCEFPAVIDIGAFTYPILIHCIKCSDSTPVVLRKIDGISVASGTVVTVSPFGCIQVVSNSFPTDCAEWNAADGDWGTPGGPFASCEDCP